MKSQLECYVPKSKGTEVWSLPTLILVSIPSSLSLLFWIRSCRCCILFQKICVCQNLAMCGLSDRRKPCTSTPHWSHWNSQTLSFLSWRNLGSGSCCLLEEEKQVCSLELTAQSRPPPHLSALSVNASALTLIERIREQHLIIFSRIFISFSYNFSLPLHTLMTIAWCQKSFSLKPQAQSFNRSSFPFAENYFVNSFPYSINSLLCLVNKNSCLANSILVLCFFLQNKCWKKNRSSVLWLGHCVCVSCFIPWHILFALTFDRQSQFTVEHLFPTS